MGLTSVRVTISNPVNPELREDVELIVDTGAVLPWIPRKVLEKIGVKPEYKKLFRTVEGRLIERSTSFARIRYGEHETVVEVVIAEEGDAAVLGVVALESMGYRVNPVTGELEYVGLLAV
ncbi:MAG: aspartyl protease family protein [Thermofilum sp.]